MNGALYLKASLASVAILGLIEQAFTQNADQPTAATEKSSLSEGPLLQNAPEFSRWTVDFSYPEDRDKTQHKATGSSNRPRKMTVTKTKQIVAEEIVDIGGRGTVRFYSGRTQYTKKAGQ